MAAAAEAAARKALDDAGAVVTDTSERTIELRELENEASLRADMYKTYVARTEEITLQANTQVSDARVIAPANIPLSPYAPRQTLILALCGIAGLGLALTIAVYRGRRYLPEYAEADEEAFAAPSDTGSLRTREDATFSPEEDLPGTQPPAVLEESDSLPGSATAEEPAAPSVLAEFTVATRPFEPDHRGRPTERTPHSILTSALTDDDGLPSQASAEAFGALVRKITAAAGASRLVLVLGADHGPAAATIALGLAHVPTRDGVLLIDASWDELPLHRAYVDEAIPGVIDVIAGRADATGIALCEEGPDLTLIGVGGPDLAADIAADVTRVADFVEKLSQDFGRIILHCGHRHSPELFQALLGRVDAVLIVADAIIEQDDEAAEMVRDLAGILPAFAGVVLVHERADSLAMAERA